MTKKEIIWRHILHETLIKGTDHFTQKNIAKTFGVSTSTVFNALKIPRQIGAINATGRFFNVRDAEKLLILWGTFRNLQKEIIYKTRVDLPVKEIESFMPADAIYGAFSAYRFTHDECPADYSLVYAYSPETAEIQKRFPKIKGTPNLFILKPDPYLHTFGKTTPAVQIFTDMWNIQEWYSKDFLSALKQDLHL